MTVPSVVTIPAGRTAATFDITIIDDGILNGSRSVTITLSATEFQSAIGVIRIDDDETAVLTLDIPTSAREAGDDLIGEGAVTSVISSAVRNTARSNSGAEFTLTSP